MKREPDHCSTRITIIIHLYPVNATATNENNIIWYCVLFAKLPRWRWAAVYTAANRTTRRPSVYFGSHLLYDICECVAGSDLRWNRPPAGAPLSSAAPWAHWTRPLNTRRKTALAIRNKKHRQFFFFKTCFVTGRNII